MERLLLEIQEDNGSTQIAIHKDLGYTVEAIANAILLNETLRSVLVGAVFGSFILNGTQPDRVKELYSGAIEAAAK
jgi:hypothetical protein